jgi:predicted porin
MKRIATLALAAAAVAAASGAHAQSTVTLFGVVDANVRDVKNGGDSVKSLSNNGLNSSRLGFRGVEDLGGGLKASFWLEHGFNIDTGTQTDATRFWNRRSTVSLSGGFGEIRLGRDFTPTYTGYTDFDVFGDNGVAASSKFASTLGTAVDTLTRADNQVQYFLPSGLGGFYGSAAVAAGEGTAGKKYVGGRAGYAAGPLNVSVAYGETDVVPVGGEDKHKVLDLGASYDLGVVKLSGYYSQDKFGSAKVDTYSLGAAVPLGAGTLRGAYTNANASGTNAAGVNIDANDANQIALGYVYNLSKRTALYTTVARVDNKGGAVFAVATPPAVVAGQKSTGYEFGIRHAF